MPNYLYKATDAGGKWLTGEIQGATRDEAEARLLERGLLVESLNEAERAPSPPDLPTRRDDLVELVGQLESLTRSGLPLPSGLRAAGQEVASRRLRASFYQIADLLESGRKLEEALASSSRRFPADLHGLIAAGSQSGRLAEMLAQYVRDANLASELRRMFFWRLAYPTLALIFVLTQVGFICTLSIKSVKSLVGTMNDFGVDRPTAVNALTDTALFINDHGLELLLGVLAIPVIAWAILRFGLARRLVAGPSARSRWSGRFSVTSP